MGISLTYIVWRGNISGSKKIKFEMMFRRQNNMDTNRTVTAMFWRVYVIFNSGGLLVLFRGKEKIHQYISIKRYKLNKQQGSPFESHAFVIF